MKTRDGINANRERCPEGLPHELGNSLSQSHRPALGVPLHLFYNVIIYGKCCPHAQMMSLFDNDVNPE